MRARHFKSDSIALALAIAAFAACTVVSARAQQPSSLSSPPAVDNNGQDFTRPEIFFRSAISIRLRRETAAYLVRSAP